MLAYQRDCGAFSVAIALKRYKQAKKNLVTVDLGDCSFRIDIAEKKACSSRAASSLSSNCFARRGPGVSPGRFKGVRGVKRGLRREAPQEPTSEGD